MNPQDAWSEIPPYALWLLGLAVAGWLVGPLIGYWLGRRSQKLQWEHTVKTELEDRLRAFRQDIAETLAKIPKTGDGVMDYNRSTRDAVLVYCARIGEDIPDANSGRFLSACADYCEIEQRANEHGRELFMHMLRHGTHRPDGTPIPPPQKADTRTLRQVMTEALEALRDCAK